MREYRYTTPHGIEVTRTASKANYRRGLKHLLRELDRHRGIYLSSGYEYPRTVFALGYRRHVPAAGDRRLRPPGGIPAAQRSRAKDPRDAAAGPGRPPALGEVRTRREPAGGHLKPCRSCSTEEERSKQPSAFSILRALIEEFRGAEDSRLALVGAFGYDLLFQFEPIEKKLPAHGHKDLHLFLCDDI